MVFPWIGVAIIQLVRCIADARAGMGGASAETIARRKANNKNDSAYRTFFLIFLLYPLLSRSTFHMMPTSCQTLAEGERWHMDDYSIDCGSATHIAFEVFAGFCICIYPVG